MKLVLVAMVACLLTVPSLGEEKETAVSKAFGLRMAGKAEDAKVLLEKTVSENASDAAAWFELARTRIYLFEFESATSAARKAADLAPMRARYRYLAGAAGMVAFISVAHDPKRRGELPALFKTGAGDLERALEIDPGHLEARKMLVEIYAQSPPDVGGDREKATAHAAKLEDLDRALGVHARCILLGRGKDAEKIALWRKLVEERPDDAAANEGLGLALLETGETEAALRHIEEALKADPSNRRRRLDLAMRLALSGRRDEAGKLVSAYLAWEPVPPAPLRAFAVFLRAKMARLDGRNEDAEKLMKKAKEIDARVWMTMMPPGGFLFDEP
jgi:Flp pilus assembly protein TadD